LKSNLLIGPASGKPERVKIVVDFDALRERERVAKNRAVLDAQRQAMAVSLGLASDADVTEIAKFAAQRHQSLPHVIEDKVSIIQTEIEKFWLSPMRKRKKMWRRQDSGGRDGSGYQEPRNSLILKRLLWRPSRIKKKSPLK